MTIFSQSDINKICFDHKTAQKIAADGGGDGDTIEELRQNTSANFATQLRNVTQDDYLVTKVGGIALQGYFFRKKFALALREVGGAILELLCGSLLTEKVRHDRFPVWESFSPEVNVLATEPIHAILGAIINQIVTVIKIFVMTENKSFVGWLTKILLDP